MNVLIDGIPVLFQQFAPLSINGKNCYSIARVYNHTLFFDPVWEPDHATLYPEASATEDLHSFLVSKRVSYSNCGKGFLPEVA